MSVLVCLVFVFVIIAVLDYVEKFKRLWGYKIAGPPFLPIIGNIHQFLFMKPITFFQWLGELSHKFDYFFPVSRLWVFKFNMLVIGIYNPKYIEPILNSSSLITKSKEYSFLNHWLGNGVLLATGKKWQIRRKIITPAFHYSNFQNFVQIFDKQTKILMQKLHRVNPNTSVDVCQLINLFALDVVCGKKWHIRRKIITPAFHFKVLENFVKIFDKQAKIFLKKIEHVQQMSPLDISRLVSLLTFDVICESTMGTSVDVQLNKNSEYVEAVHEITNIIHKRSYNAFLRPEFLFRLSPSGARERKLVKTLHKWTNRLIEKRRENLLNFDSTRKSDGNTDIGQKDKMVLLDILLQATVDGKPLTNDDIREEVSTFMFAGHDTTTSGISFLLYNIALNPDVQEKIVEEIQNVIGMDSEKELCIGDLKNLTYLECVVKESLRLFPPVPMIGRYFDEDTYLKDLRIPAKSTVIIGAFYMGRNPELFPEPDVFKPERFLDDNSENTRNPFSYIPFSAGPRNCIGQKFALLEMKTIVVRILQKFRISVDPSYDKPQLFAAIVLRSENGIILNFQKRK